MFPNMPTEATARKPRIAAGSPGWYALREILDDLDRQAAASDAMTAFGGGAGAMYAAEANAMRTVAARLRAELA